MPAAAPAARQYRIASNATGSRARWIRLTDRHGFVAGHTEARSSARAHIFPTFHQAEAYRLAHVAKPGAWKVTVTIPARTAGA